MFNELRTFNRNFNKSIKAYYPLLTIMLLIFILVSFSNIYPNNVIGIVINNISTKKYYEAQKYIILYFLIRVIGLIFSFISSYIKERVRVGLEKNLRIKSIQIILSNNYQNLMKLDSTQYSSRIFDSTQSLTNAILNLITWIGKSLTSLIFTIYFLCKISLKLTLFMLPFIIIMALLTKRLSHVQKRYNSENLINEAELNNSIQEISYGLECIKINKCKDYVINRYSKSEENRAKSKLKFSMSQQFSMYSLSSFGIIIISIILFYSTKHISEYSVGDITSLILYSGTAFSLVMDVFDNLIIFQVLESSLKRFNELIPEKLSTDFEIREKNLDQIYEGHISIDNLVYSYGDKKIFDKINFEIPTGSKVAIVGENGTGKTTLIKLISGLIKPESGNVRVNGISTYDLEYFKFISYCAQKPFLFKDTVFNNIVLGKNISNLENIKTISNIDDSLMDRHVEENGKNISNGQMQKINIARSLLDNNNILLFDELESSLDSTTIKNLYDYIFSVNKTAICITHNHNYLDKFDFIIYLVGDGSVLINKNEFLKSNSLLYKNFIS